MPIQSIYDAVLSYDKARVVEEVRKELAAGRDVSEILSKGLIAPLDEVGEKFSKGFIFIPEMLMAAVAMKEGLGIVKPILSETKSNGSDTVIIGSVKGDLHDIGKNLVGMMLEGAGFRVIDLGVDVDTEKYANAVKQEKASIVALSALLTTTMSFMDETVRDLKREIPDIKIMVGGAPVNQSFADKIGADGYGVDAPNAVKMAREFIRSER